MVTEKNAKQFYKALHLMMIVTNEWNVFSEGTITFLTQYFFSLNKTKLTEQRVLHGCEWQRS